jgi:glucuronate isomerase
MDLMTRDLRLHPDRLLPANPAVRAIARELYASVKDLPIVSPHGHTDPRWFATDEPWTNATELLLAPDHYLYRMLYSQGVPLDALGVPRRAGPSKADPRDAWRLFASHYYLFRGTPSRVWLDHVFAEVFGFDVALDATTADLYFDRINEALATAAFRPRALFDRFNIELLATTEGAHEELDHHATIRRSDWKGRVITTYRPDAVVDPEHEGFADALRRFGQLTGEDVHSWEGYLAAHRKRRADFRAAGATATDHGHPTPATADLSDAEKQALFARIVGGSWTTKDAELFRAQMLTEMAAMSIEDGMVMQIHPGSFRNHNRWLHQHYGRDKGADIPQRTDYVRALKPLLDRFGNELRLSIILFTLGFNDDTRAFLSIPARHDVARRVDCGFLARLVAEHRIADWEAAELAHELTYDLVRRAYRLEEPHTLAA